MRRNSKNYYAVVDKNTLEVGIFVEKSQVCEYIGISKMTFYRNFVGGKLENDNYVVTFAKKVVLKSNRGDKKGLNLGEFKR
jgi:hypothetical protein